MKGLRLMNRKPSPFDLVLFWQKNEPFHYSPSRRNAGAGKSQVGNNMEPIENIGLFLKNLREEKKIPVAQVAQALKTKPETIQAIEANDFQKIPAVPYIKGYLRSYSNYLGIDSEHILEEYNRQYPNTEKPLFIYQGQKLPRVGIDIRKFINPKVIIAMGFVILIIISIVLLKSFKPKDKLHASVKESSTPAAQNNMPKESEKPPASLISTPITTPILLSAHAIDTVWLRVFSDGKIIFQGVLQKGEEENWQAQNEFKLRIGNPNKVNLALNGKPTGSISPYGPVNVTINEKGIKTEK